ncbi:hypothetical protein BHQ15_05975 [Mycolicibacillus koreensis]|nr:hypothetical protein BHQ15_05975 [Mycolicibacillus koreensis]
MASYNIPYLFLPQSTPKDVALDVFVKMNTSNIRLTPFDIVVAQVEAAAGASMHELLEGISSQVPKASAYGDLGTLLLDVSCLHSNCVASKANYLRLDFDQLPTNWAEMADALTFTVGMLEGERVFDNARLPSQTVVPVVTALYRDLPTSPDALGNARSLLRYYLWRAFLTRRYESATSGRAFQDYLALREAITSGVPFTEVHAPIFDESNYPLPTVEQLMTTRWPKSRDILARGVLALSLREGARDIADDEPAARENVKVREYHHLFPDSTLIKRAKLGADESYRALNCALITWRTNRKVSNLSPLQYLKDRIDASRLGESEIEARLQLHLVPWGQINQAGPYLDGCDPQLIRNDYMSFLEARANLVAEEARQRAGAGKIGDRFAPQRPDQADSSTANREPGNYEAVPSQSEGVVS